MEGSVGLTMFKSISLVGLLINFRPYRLDLIFQQSSTGAMMKVLPHLDQQPTDTMHFSKEEKFNTTLKGIVDI